MIRLIAADLDGTLLDPAGNLPVNTFSIIDRLYAKGILFCAASGRPISGLRKLFEPVADRILFIAENGAIVAKGSQILHSSSIAPQDIRRALDAIASVPDAHPLLCTPECAYYQQEAEPFIKFVRISYLSNARADLGRIAQAEQVCKIAVYDEIGPEKNGMRILPAKLPKLRVIQSGGNWLDISEPDAHKGNAMRMIQDILRLTRDECMAFGDHMNDRELLESCGHAYVPENAYPALKALFPNVVASNAEAGVQEAMLAVAEGKMPRIL